MYASFFDELEKISTAGALPHILDLEGIDKEAALFSFLKRVPRRLPTPLPHGLTPAHMIEGLEAAPGVAGHSAIEAVQHRPTMYRPGQSVSMKSHPQLFNNPHFAEDLAQFKKNRAAYYKPNKPVPTKTQNAVINIRKQLAAQRPNIGTDPTIHAPRPVTPLAA